MSRIASLLAIALCAGSTAPGASTPEELLERFLAKIRPDLDRLPNYVCRQTVERFGRISAERPWERIDRLKLEVALVGDKELYGIAGGPLQDRPLAELVPRGAIATGKLGLLARHVFLGSRARFAYRYQTEQDGRRVHEFDYEVPAEQSAYQLRTSRGEAAVAFQGSFRFDEETSQLLRLEVIAYDIPEKLGVAEANIDLEYGLVRVGGTETALPVSATLTVVALDGTEDRNHMRLEGCQQYHTLAEVRFEDKTGPPPEEFVEEMPPAAEVTLPRGAVIEVALDHELDPAAVAVDAPVRARLVKPLFSGPREVIPAGSLVLGRVTRLVSEALPFPRYELGLEFDTLDTGGQRLPLVATMADAGPAPGLLRQSKRLDPTFERRRNVRMDILVREVQRGQGILYWDARRGPLRSGLRMKWRVEEDIP
jgi:hypothetical protein